MSAWAANGTSWDFGHELLADDFDKIKDSIEFAYKRFPVLERAGVKNVSHGPFTFAPDGNPLVGPVPGLRNYWSACGVMAGFSQGGGVGLMLAQWIIQGKQNVTPWLWMLHALELGSTKDILCPKLLKTIKRDFQFPIPMKSY